MNEKIKVLIKEIRPFVLVFLATIFVYKFIIMFGPVVSSSMETTLMTNDIVIFSRIAYTFSDVERGDIVAFKQNDEQWLKRVIGISGDTISFKDGYVYVNDQLLNEDYLDEGTVTYCDKTFCVPEGYIFVMGDNREDSFDSRYWDNPYVDEDNISGKLLIDIGQFGK